MLLEPPHSVEAEQAVLGAVMAYPGTFDRIADVVRSADFYIDQHRLIFESTVRVAERGTHPDALAVSAALEAVGGIQNAGGLPFLIRLAQNAPAALNAGRHAQIIVERSRRRQILAAAHDLAARAAMPGHESPEELIAEAEAELLRIADRSEGDPVGLADSMAEALRWIDSRDQFAGLWTGIEKLDDLTGGLEPGQLVLIAGRPGSGKTILGLNIADHVARLNGASVLLFSLEMSRRELALRLMASRSAVPVHAMRSGTATVQQWEAMNATTADSRRPLFIDDKPAVSVAYVRAKARRWKRSHGLQLIVIDYLQLMRGQGDNRVQEVGSISRGLKALAKELEIPIVALAQLSRAASGRADARPQLSDLRDSGELEQDADIVVMLHREELHRDAPEWKGLAELFVRKNRNGPAGRIVLRCDAAVMRFDRYDGPEPGEILPPVRRASGFCA
ncbi:MAG: replicative DNA helicase [Burkholderiales bacterium]|nr:replicative DNA helicase [Burkholderiales bacterium]